MKIKTSNTILYCSQWDETVSFYRTHLNLSVHFSTDWFVEFILSPTSRISIADQKRASIKSSNGEGVTLSFEVEDIDNEWQFSKQAGSNPTEIKNHAWNARVFYLFDPEGHRIEIWQSVSKPGESPLQKQCQRGKKMTEKKYSKYIIDISDDDILTAMKSIEGYIDITPSDFKELYFFACNHAAERLINSIVAEDIMTKTVISVKRDTPLKEVAAVMSLHGISGVPVTGDQGDVIGVISEKDFLLLSGQQTKSRSFMEVIAQGLGNTECITVPLYEKKAEDIMTSPAITVGETTPVSDIMALFTAKNINRVPVLSQEANLVGIVSRTDVIRSPFPKSKE